MKKLPHFLGLIAESLMSSEQYFLSYCFHVFNWLMEWKLMMCSLRMFWWWQTRQFIRTWHSSSHKISPWMIHLLFVYLLFFFFFSCYKSETIWTNATPNLFTYPHILKKKRLIFWLLNTSLFEYLPQVVHGHGWRFHIYSFGSLNSCLFNPDRIGNVE